MLAVTLVPCKTTRNLEWHLSHELEQLDDGRVEQVVATAVVDQTLDHLVERLK